MRSVLLFRVVLASLLVLGSGHLHGQQGSPAPPSDPRRERLRQARELVQAGSFADAEQILDELWEPGETDDFLEEVHDLRAMARLSQLNLSGAYDDCYGHDDVFDYRRQQIYSRHAHRIRGICHDVAGHIDEAVEKFVSLFLHVQDPTHQYGRLYVCVVTGETVLLDPLLDVSVWVGDLARFLVGRVSAESLLESASRPRDGEDGPNRGFLRLRRECEAHFFIGRDAERRGDLDRAREHYRASVATGMNRDYEVMWSRARLAKLEGRLGDVELPRHHRTLNGYVDSSGKLVIPPRFEQAGPFDDGVARVEVRDCRSGVGAIDRTGKFLIPPVFDEVFPFGANGVARVQRGERFGFVDRDGALVTPVRFSDAGDFGESDLAFARDPESGLYGYIGSDGEWRVAPRFADARSFREGLAGVRESGEWWRVIDENGEQFWKFRSSRPIDFFDGVAFVRPQRGGLTGLIRRTGEWVVPPKFTTARSFHENRAAVASRDVDRGRSYYFIDSSGRRVGDEIFDTYYPFRAGLAPVRRNGRWGVIDHAGELVLEPKYEWTGVGDNGVSLRPEGELYAYVDREGSPIAGGYLRARDFRDGTGSVLTKGGWGVIDLDGEWVIPAGQGNDEPMAEGLLAVERPASDRDWARIDPIGFPEYAREHLERIAAEQRLADLLSTLEQRAASLAVSIPIASPPEPDPDHVKKRAILDQAIELLEADDVAGFYSQCLTRSGRAALSAFADDTRIGQRDIPQEILESVVGHVSAIEESREEVLRYLLERSGIEHAHIGVGSVFERQILMEAVPAFAEQQRALYVESAQATRALGVLSFCREQLAHDHRVHANGLTVVLFAPKGSGLEWSMTFGWESGAWVLEWARKNQDEHL